MLKYKTDTVPYIWARAGLFQPVAHFVKLLSKEDIVPMVCDKLIFSAAPIIYLTLPLTALFVIPIAGNSGVVAFEGDLLFVMFVFTLMVITVFLAGWSSMNRYSIIGGVRAMLQMVSFEIPMALALIGPAIAAKSLSISTISQWQSTATWMIFLQPVVHDGRRARIHGGQQKRRLEDRVALHSRGLNGAQTTIQTSPYLQGAPAA